MTSKLSRPLALPLPVARRALLTGAALLLATAVVAEGSFDVALPAVAAGAGALLLASAALLVVVLRRSKAGGADGRGDWERG